MITEFDKAIVAVAVPLIVFVLTHFGFKVNADFGVALTAVLTGLAVYIVPNKQ